MPEPKLSPPLQSALDALDHAIDGMSDEQMKWHPEAKWSSSDILEHLSLAYSRTAERMKPLLQGAKPEVRRRTLKEWFGGMIVLKLEHIPPGRKAPEALCPKGLTPSQVKSCVRENLCQLDKIIDQCEQRFGENGNIMVHVILGPLSTSEWRKFHRVHTLHHARQIEALKKQIKGSSDLMIGRAQS